MSDRQREKDFQAMLNGVDDDRLKSILRDTKRTTKEESGTEDGRIAGIYHRVARQEAKKREQRKAIAVPIN